MVMAPVAASHTPARCVQEPDPGAVVGLAVSVAAAAVSARAMTNRQAPPLKRSVKPLEWVPFWLTTAPPEPTLDSLTQAATVRLAVVSTAAAPEAYAVEPLSDSAAAPVLAVVQPADPASVPLLSAPESSVTRVPVFSLNCHEVVAPPPKASAIIAGVWLETRLDSIRTSSIRPFQ